VITEPFEDDASFDCGTAAVERCQIVTLRVRMER